MECSQAFFLRGEELTKVLGETTALGFGSGAEELYELGELRLLPVRKGDGTGMASV